MLPDKYRRLWRRRLRRRPLLPFVLAAFLAIDVVIAAVEIESSRLNAIGGGFISAQISLLAIWITYSCRQLMIRAAVALGLTILVAFCIAYDGPNGFYGAAEYLAIVASICTLLVVTSSLTAGLVRLVALRLLPAGLRARQRLTIGGILTFTLIAALMVAVFRDTRLEVLSDPLVVGFIVAGVVPTLWIAVAIAFLGSGWPRLLFAVVLPVAVTLPLLVAERSEMMLPFFAQTVFCGLATCLLDWRRLERSSAHEFSVSTLESEVVPEAHIDLKA